MTLTFHHNFSGRFRRRVLLPGALILLATAILCGGALIAAGRGTDAVSVEAQKLEAWRATTAGLDTLALAQESVGLCEECIDRAHAAPSGRQWLDQNIGFRLFDLFGTNETYILAGDNRPVYAAVERQESSPSAYARVAPVTDRFVKLVRGEIKRPSGRSNLNERLPGSPPAPITFPPMPGLSDEPVTVFPTVRTTPDVVHATDLARIGDRVAFVSAMVMARTGEKAGAAPDAPVLVNVRYLDGPFLLQLSKQHYLTDARLGIAPEPREGEVWTQLMDSDGGPLTNIFWKPMLGGAAVVGALLLPAAAAFGVIVLLVLAMALHMRKLMKRDDDHLAELGKAHVELEAKEAQAHHLAYHDVLTGLPNRALFNDTADKALIRARHGESMAILLLDLDRFKNVNDRFGHLAGDALIQQVAQRLGSVIGKAGTVARLGGDEFAILLEGDSGYGRIEQTLACILEELRKPFDVLGHQAFIGVSVGIALAPECGTDRTELMRKADIALYRAKDEGRDCYRLFTDEMDETVQLRAGLETELRAALASGHGLSVHYQPLVSADGRKVIGLEALLRWNCPYRGWVSPQLFVPVAEEAGLICELGDWVLREACRVAGQWPNLTIAVNLSPVQFCDEGLADRICGIVHGAGVSPHQVELEVTESVVLDQNEMVRGTLARLRREGFRIALDDFGTGYSSLSFLRDFEVDRIKIDKSFIQSLGHTVDAGAIVTAVVTLGHAMGLQVTAEGVETLDQEDFLRAAGCNLLQGYRFSRAVPEEKLARSLDELKRRKAA
jgi:diguanylate cyclase (GGDEF)-like protein